jgi:hypothetical protein
LKSDIEQKGNKNSLEEAIRSVLLLGIPVVIVGDTVLHFPSDSLSLQSFLLYFYAVFLSSYMLNIFFYEYYIFPELHTLKPPPFDFLLLTAMFLSIRQFSLSYPDMCASLLWLGMFLLSLTIWEIFTMAVGLKTHFKECSSTLRPLAMLRHLFCALSYNFDRRIKHWDEYRYWLMLDSGLFIIVSVAYLWRVFANENIADAIFYWLIFSIGFYIGLFNVYRYRLVLCAVKK